MLISTPRPNHLESNVHLTDLLKNCGRFSASLCCLSTSKKSMAGSRLILFALLEARLSTALPEYLHDLNKFEIQMRFPRNGTHTIYLCSTAFANPHRPGHLHENHWQLSKYFRVLKAKNLSSKVRAVFAISHLYRSDCCLCFWDKSRFLVNYSGRIQMAV